MRTFCCFSFYNEFDLLEIKLNELYDYVDFFVIVEANFTHSGKSKPLYFLECDFTGQSKRFEKFLDKILLYTVTDMPITKSEIGAALSSKDRKWILDGYQKEDAWVRERFQRNQMMVRLDEFAEPDDMIIIEDADEMVKPSAIEWAKKNIQNGSISVGQTMYSYYLNVRCSIPWCGSKILLKKNITTPSEDRFHTVYPQHIENGGWHFAFMGGADAIRAKIHAYAHTEFSTPDVLFRVEERLAKLEDVLGRNDRYSVVPIDETYPKYLVQNLDKFDHMIYKE